MNLSRKIHLKFWGKQNLKFPRLAKRTVYIELLVYLIMYMTYFLVKSAARGLPFLPTTFWVFKLALPLALYCLLKVRPISASIKNVCVGGLVGGVVVVMFARLMGFGFGTILWNWSYEAFIEYAVFSIVYLELFCWKVKNHFEALTLTMMLLIVVGFLYEAPIYYESVSNLQHLVAYRGYPFLINSRFLVGAILFQKIGVTPFLHRTVWVAFLLWLLFSVWFGFNPKVLPQWLPRLPTFVFWVIPLVKMRGGVACG